MKATKVIIEPRRKFSFQAHELWQYRELFYIFTWRDIKVKYKQTYLGVLWVVLQPLGLLLLLSLVFAKNFTTDTGGIPYPIFVLSGLLLWNLFYASVSSASDSILQHADMIRKIYFPRLIIPVSSVLAACFDFVIALLVFAIFCVVYGAKPSLHIVWLLPLAITLTVVSAFGMSVFLSALTVRFRDVRYVIPFLLQFLFFATQIVYSLNSLKQNWLKWLLALNPVNGAVEIFRGMFTNAFNTELIFVSALSALVITVGGYIYFKQTEAYFADLA